MNKRNFTIMICLILSCSLTMSAFAADVGSGSGGISISDELPTAPIPAENLIPAENDSVSDAPETEAEDTSINPTMPLDVPIETPVSADDIQDPDIPYVPEDVPLELPDQIDYPSDAAAPSIVPDEAQNQAADLAQGTEQGEAPVAPEPSVSEPAENEEAGKETVSITGSESDIKLEKTETSASDAQKEEDTGAEEIIDESKEETNADTVQLTRKSSSLLTSNNGSGITVAQGDCGDQGDNVHWRFQVDHDGLTPKGILLISGTGDMRNYNHVWADQQPWKSYTQEINSIIVESGVKSIGVNAFKSCGNLESVSLPDGLENISCYAFSDCKKIEYISIPDTVTWIAYNAFSGCTGLKRIDIPPKITSIELSAFSDCNNLRIINLPSGLTRIDEYAFDHSSIKYIVIPKTVTFIGRNAFCWCEDLRDVYYEGSEEDWERVSIGIQNGPLTSARMHYNYNGETIYTSIDYNGKELLLKNWDLDNLITSEGYINIDEAVAALALSNATYLSSDNVDDILLDLDLVDEVYDGAWRWPYAYDSNGVAHTFALKKYNGHNYITVVVRGSNNGEDWFTVDLFAFGFQRVAGEILGDLENFLSDRGVDKNDKNNVFFITGHSMGGAVAGDMAKIIETTWSTNASQINCYTFASPFNVYDWVDYTFNSNPWYFIHNIVNEQDGVTDVLQPGIFPIRWGRNYYYNSDHSDTKEEFKEWYKYLTGNDFSINNPIEHFNISHDCKTYMALLLSESNSQRKNKREVVVRCPVDISIINQNGSEIAAIIDNVVAKCEDSDIVLTVVGDEKFITFMNEEKYQLRLTATNNGTMQYEVTDIEVQASGDADNLITKTFENVNLNDGKKMYSVLEKTGDIPDTRLLIIDENGNPVKEINEDGTEAEYSDEQNSEPNKPENSEDDNPDKGLKPTIQPETKPKSQTELELYPISEYDIEEPISNFDKKTTYHHSQDSSSSGMTTVDADYLNELRVKLANAIALGGEQIVFWNKGTSLPYDIMKTLEDHPNLTLVFQYKYLSADYFVTIPGNIVKTDARIPWYGPLYLYINYGIYSPSVNISTLRAQDAQRTYTVKPGDTLSKIASRLKTTVKDIASINSIENPDRIRAGQVLKY